TAGWMAAAAFSKVLGAGYDIRLIESEEIGTVGVGEATVPHLKLFNNLLEIDEIEFVKQVQGTFKLGIQFNDWGRLGDSYIHGFGSIGHDVSLLPFHQFWIKARQQGFAADIGDYSLNTLAAPRGKFMASATDVPANSPLANIAYAYHFDAGLYARYLRGYAEQRGVRRTEGKIRQTTLRATDGFVESVSLESGECVAGELFIDCSGFRGLLIEQALHTGYDDFTHWLPCDRALAVPCESIGPPTPYTRSTARAAGWQWRIPLQNRTGNGYVYASTHLSDDEAAATLLQNLDGPALAEPRLLRFTTGMRRKVWNKNVVALGLASGFLEPLESTSIYMIQSGIARLLNLFPRADFSAVVSERYNAQAVFEYERIRDFLILHYHATARDDSAFWRQCRAMSIPPQLRDNIALFRDSGRFFRDAEEMFATVSWVQVMLGQGIDPRGYHPLVDQMPEHDLRRFIDGVGKVVASCVDSMPMHQVFIDRYCVAPGLPA
ncbi:MAG: tryptophan 7-halogenase, partial [Xanthomonadaceae bacterium]|nr:tryptophan 7-halogenase [Xanthomonadaceae bacterium]